ncbi:unnamed protein product [Acanthoscelides obtectus]|uniref:O-acyltransferase WSD1 C-terminal domain-containing protein n=1 Tax=Acanthoscelides obtectus TaxID=200917 RepID=A0A9P0K6C1_ACAOB|nr:unnamed protein product [Acanthoscelides obtectus]CAK1631118.1 hypothetical protein AOBTE_LOCUS6760 [Acanthoscelides obtectus]
MLLTGPKYVIPPKVATKESLAVLLFLLSLILLTIVAPILLLFIILRTSARVILKLKHGKNYGGLVDSEDVMWKIEDITNPLINILTIQQSKISNPEEYFDYIKQCFNGATSGSNAHKLTSICKFFVGYAYYLDNQLTIDDICNKLTVDNGKNYLVETELKDILGDLAGRPMPKDNLGLFEVLVVQKSLKHVDPDTYQYAVIFRVDHIVADGINLTTFLLQNFADDQEGLKRNLKDLISKFDTSKTKISKKSGWQSIVQTARCIGTFMVHFPIVFANQLFVIDCNCLHGPKLSGKKFAVYSVEEEGEDLMNTVKQIKRKVAGSSFSSVMLTAVSRAVGKHMQKINTPDDCIKLQHQLNFVLSWWVENKLELNLRKCKIVSYTRKINVCEYPYSVDGSVLERCSDRQCEIPDFLSVLITALFSIPSMEKTAVLENNFSMGIMNMPLIKRPETAYCQIGLMEKYWNEMKEKPDFLVNFLMFKHVFGLIPIPILARTLRADKVTMSISNLPGVPKVQVYGGQQLEKLVFFTPHRGTAGMGITIITYDNKFQMGLMIDKVLISSKEEAQKLLDDVLKEIRRMEEELGLS